MNGCEAFSGICQEECSASQPKASPLLLQYVMSEGIASDSE